MREVPSTSGTPSQRGGAAPPRAGAPARVAPRAVLRNPRPGSWALMVGVALLTGGLAVVASLALGIRLRDPDGFLGPSYVRLPALVVGFLLADLLPRLALRVRAAGRAGQQRAAAARAVLRERLTAGRLTHVLVGLISFYVTYVGYRNLKSYLPFLRGELHDGDLLRLDELMAFGADPGQLAHELLGTTVAAHVLSAVYLFFLFFVPFSLAMALVWVRDPRDGYWYVTALGLNWALGTASYYLLPSLGPVYADPGVYADLPETGVSDLQASLMTSRVLVLADPFGTNRIHGIAAFASLHVSIVLTAALVAQFSRLSRVVRWALWVFVALTAVATVYFGWHYLIDVVGGVAIAGLSVWLAALGTRGWRERARSSPTGPAGPARG
ncbi:phosphatase PAP2 family protein [Kineococcus arenarius]|uniref:phosphatase PAP2 family protein n=1 Tax=Kineococcus sp. SYSU DK007 TaxID=3383128 RepID=UPI003D7E898C